jgi:uncharacterized membrane-anchored protein YhcB (DUF1043 family)
MTKEELFFVCGMLFGITFQWSSTLCALIIGIVIGYHSAVKPSLPPTTTDSSLNIIRRKKRSTTQPTQTVEKEESTTTQIIDFLTQPLTSTEPHVATSSSNSNSSVVDQIYNSTFQFISSFKKE